MEKIAQKPSVIYRDPLHISFMNHWWGRKGQLVKDPVVGEYQPQNFQDLDYFFSFQRKQKGLLWIWGGGGVFMEEMQISFLLISRNKGTLLI